MKKILVAVLLYGVPAPSPTFNEEALSLPQSTFTQPKITRAAVFFTLAMALHGQGPTLKQELARWEATAKQLDSEVHRDKDLKRALKKLDAVLPSADMESALLHANDPGHPAMLKILDILPKEFHPDFLHLAQAYYDAFLEGLKVSDLMGGGKLDAHNPVKLNSQDILAINIAQYSFAKALRQARLILFPNEIPMSVPIAPADQPLFPRHTRLEGPKHGFYVLRMAA